MAFEATFYTLAHPFPPSVLKRLAEEPGLKVDLMPQSDVHEHLCGFLAFMSAIGGSLPHDRWTKLSEYIIAVGEVINIEINDRVLTTELEKHIQRTLGGISTGVWLKAEGVFDGEGRLIVGNESDFDPRAQIPDVPEPRKSHAGFLYGAIEQEREHLDQNQAPSAARLTARPLDECYRMIQHGCEKAKRYGFTAPEDQFLFLSVMLEIGPNFDDHPEIQKILRDPSIKPSARLDACVDHPDAERIWQEVDNLIDLSQWSAASPH